MSLWTALRDWARRLRREGLTLWLACRHPGTPWLPRLLAVVVVAYALSPIDLIPDVIPVLGYLDELLLLPALVWLAVRLLPPAVRTECREGADAWLAAGRARPRSVAGAVVIALLWLACAAVLGAWAWQWWSAR